MRVRVMVSAIVLVGGARLFVPGPGSKAARAQEQSKGPAQYRPYDGKGRYSMARIQGENRLQGMTTVARRFGRKPYDKLWRSGCWQSERLVFRDLTTGARIVRLTDDYGSDAVDYHKGSWSADGARIVWRRRPGMWEPSTDTNGPTLVNADGTGLRPVFRDAPGSKMVRKHQCDKNDPDICYSLVGDKKLCAFSLQTGRYLRTLATPGGCWHLKMSLDGKWLLGYTKKDGRRFLWLVPTDAKNEADGNRRARWISLAKSIHDSYYVHPTEPCVMFWYEGDYRREGFRQKRLDNTGEQATGVLFDWNHGDFGLKGVCAHESGRAYYYQGTQWRVSPKSAYALEGEEYYDIPANYNGYSSIMPKDSAWVVGSRLVYPPYVSELQMHAIEPVVHDRVPRFRLCLIGLQRGGCLDGVDGSPDGTKFLFNSDLWDANQVFYVVARNPEPPRALKFAGRRLTWQAARHCKETKGYLVYRASASGGPYARVSGLLADAAFTDASAPPRAYYVVTALEHSGLESPYSREVASSWRGAPVRMHVEAEQGKPEPAIWPCFSGAASDLYYLWCRKRNAVGKVRLRVAAPAAGKYRLWARCRGRGTWRMNGATVTCDREDWIWLAASTPLPLQAGENQLVLFTADYGLALDCLWLATDDGFRPRGKGPEDATPPPAVQGLRAVAEGPFQARLSWQPVKAPDLSHYDLYASSEARCPCTRANLVASPAGAQYLDWKLHPGATTYYRLRAVDRRGNASAPTSPVAITTASLRVVTRKLPASTGASVELKLPADTPAGEYRLWVQVQGNARGYLKLHVNEVNRTWTMRAKAKVAKASWISYGQFGIFPLKPGGNRLVLDGKGKDFRITALAVSNDLSWKPAGHVQTACAW